MRELVSTIDALPPPAPWSHWAEFGFLLDLPRIPGEEIPAYRARLLDVVRHRSGPTHQGLAFGMARELGLRIVDDALVLTHILDGDGLPILPELRVSVRSDGILFTAPELVTSETHQVPTDTLSFDLDDELARFAITILDENGAVISPRRYRIDWLRGRITCSRILAGRILTVSYHYGLRVALDDDLSAIADEIAALAAPGGQAFVAATVKDGCGDLPAAGLLLFGPRAIDGPHVTTDEVYHDELRLAWSEVTLRSLSDAAFLRAEEDSELTWHGTRIMRWVEAAKNLAHVTWDRTRFDQDRWGVDMGILEVPTLCDGQVGHLECPDPAHATRYSVVEATALSGLCPFDDLPLVTRGLRRHHMRSGVGGAEALEVVVGSSGGVASSPTSSYDHILSAEEIEAEGETLLIEGEF